MKDEKPPKTITREEFLFIFSTSNKIIENLSKTRSESDSKFNLKFLKNYMKLSSPNFHSEKKSYVAMHFHSFRFYLKVIKKKT